MNFFFFFSPQSILIQAGAQRGVAAALHSLMAKIQMAISNLLCAGSVTFISSWLAAQLWADSKSWLAICSLWVAETAFRSTGGTGRAELWGLPEILLKSPSWFEEGVSVGLLSRGVENVVNSVGTYSGGFYSCKGMEFAPINDVLSINAHDVKTMHLNSYKQNNTKCQSKGKCS